MLTYELTGIKPESGLHFTLKELRAFQLSLMHQKSGKPVPDILLSPDTEQDYRQRSALSNTRGRCSLMRIWSIPCLSASTAAWVLLTKPTGWR